MKPGPMAEVAIKKAAPSRMLIVSPLLRFWLVCGVESLMIFSPPLKIKNQTNTFRIT
jgi:hypothetical protein